VAPAWEAPAASPGPPSVPVAAEEVGVLASLIDSEAHVDAADWARASSAVVGSGVLKAGRPVEAEEVAAAAQVSAEAEEVAAAATVLLPEEPETVEAEEVAAVAQVSAEAEEVAAAAKVSAEAEEVAAATTVLLPDEPETLEAEEVVAAAAQMSPTPPTSELGRAEEAPLAPLPETEAWLDIARRGFDQVPEPGAVTAETAVSPTDDWVTVAEPPELAQQPTLEGALAPISVQAQPPAPSVVTPPPAAPLALPPLSPVQEVAPRQAAPATPPPGLAVWATPIDPGPFAKPYQAPPPEATIFMSDAPVTLVPPVSPDARHVAPPVIPPGPQPIVPPDPRSPQPSAGQAMPGQAGALPPTLPSSMANVPPLAGPATGQLPPRAVPAPPGVSAGQPPSSRHGAASRACPSCSLPLSTRARFCRRCGAPQPA
jgi:hypothetical protein